MKFSEKSVVFLVEKSPWVMISDSLVKRSAFWHINNSRSFAEIFILLNARSVYVTLFSTVFCTVVDMNDWLESSVIFAKIIFVFLLFFFCLKIVWFLADACMYKYLLTFFYFMLWKRLRDTDITNSNRGANGLINISIVLRTRGGIINPGSEIFAKFTRFESSLIVLLHSEAVKNIFKQLFEWISNI